MHLPFTRQELKALLLLGATGLVGLTGRLVSHKAPGALSESHRISLATASAEMLETLPGIGPVTARRIVEERRRRGRFVRVEDLTRVKGISRATAGRLRSRVTLD